MLIKRFSSTMNEYVKRGLFITFEGTDGVGKSTQADLLAEALRTRGYQVCLTREPGGSAAAEALRHLLLLGEVSFSLRSEILVHFAARFDHVERVISPALQEGQIVLCTRFSDSTIAYQGYGWGKGDQKILSFIDTLNKHLERQPDKTFLLKTSRQIAKQRLATRSIEQDYYECAEEAFHKRVIAGFEEIALQQTERVCCIETTNCPIHEVHDKILQEVLAVSAHFSNFSDVSSRG